MRVCVCVCVRALGVCVWVGGGGGGGGVGCKENVVPCGPVTKGLGCWLQGRIATLDVVSPACAPTRQRVGDRERERDRASSPSCWPLAV